MEQQETNGILAALKGLKTVQVIIGVLLVAIIAFTSVMLVLTWQKTAKMEKQVRELVSVFIAPEGEVPEEDYFTADDGSLLDPETGEVIPVEEDVTSDGGVSGGDEESGGVG